MVAESEADSETDWGTARGGLAELGRARRPPRWPVSGHSTAQKTDASTRLLATSTYGDGLSDELLVSELYALTHRGNPGDSEFYARACRNASAVLELGAGAGRLLGVLAGAAHSVVGLERELAMLEAARRNLSRLPSGQRRRTSLLRGDMTCFELERRFDRVLLPYNALYCLLNRRAVRRCFRAVRAHLAPGGRFLLDVWVADRFHAEAHSRTHRDEPGPIVSLQHRGQVWDVFERSRLCRRRQRLDVEYTYVSRERGASVVSRIEQRYSTSQEIGQLLAAEGFRIEARWGEFDLRRFTRRSPRLILQAAVG